MLKVGSAPIIIPIPATTDGLICPVGTCSHSRRVGEDPSFPLAQNQNFPLASLSFYEWFLTESSFGWWQRSFHSLGVERFTWSKWALSNTKCCLVSSSSLCLKLSQARFKLALTHHVSFVDETRFVISSKGESTGSSKFSFFIDWIVTTQEMTQSEIKIALSFDLKNAPPKSVQEELISTLQKIFQGWFTLAEERTLLIVEGKEIEQIPLIDEKDLPEISDEPSKGGAAAPVVLSVPLKNWHLGVLVVTLVLIIPLLSLLFFRVRSASSSLEEQRILLHEISQKIISLQDTLHLPTGDLLDSTTG